MTSKELAYIESLEEAAFAGTSLDAAGRALLLFKHLSALVGASNGKRELFDEFGFTRRQPHCVSASIEAMHIPHGARVLFVDLRMIGDAVQDGEVMAVIKERFSCRVSYLGLRGCARVIASCDAVDAVHELDVNAVAGNQQRALEIIAALCAEIHGNYDCVVNMNQTIAAMLLTQAACAPLVYGWTLNEKNQGIFRGNRFHHRLFTDAYLHLQEQMLRCVVTQMPARSAWPLFTETAAWRAMIPRGAIGILVGARIATRRWTAEKWIACARELLAQGRSAVVFGSADDRATAAAITAALPDVVDCSARIPLEELGAAMACCDLVITTDSGGKHVAAAGGAACVEVSGAGNRFEQCGPYVSGSVVIQRDLPCLHCLSPDCPHQRCMQEIPAQAVSAAVAVLLSDGERFLRLRDTFAANDYKGLSVWYSGDARPDLCFVPQAVRHDWTVESAFARIKGFCDDACLALANERATGEHSAHTARREIVSATWETFDPAIRDAVSSRLLGLLRSVSAQEDGWIFRMNADLAMLGALPGDGDDLERFDRAMKEDIAAYAQILTEVKAWTDQS